MVLFASSTVVGEAVEPLRMAIRSLNERASTRTRDDPAEEIPQTRRGSGGVTAKRTNMDNAMAKVACLLLIEEIMAQDEEHGAMMAQMRLLCTALVALLGAAAHLGVGRRCWILPRPKGAFETTIDLWPEDLFRQELRVGKKLFEFLCEALSRDMQREDTKFREAVPVRRQVAIALKKLATWMSYLEIAHKYEVGKTTVARIVHEFCALVETKLRCEQESEVAAGLRDVELGHRARHHGWGRRIAEGHLPHGGEVGGHVMEGIHGGWVWELGLFATDGSSGPSAPFV